MKEKDVYSIFSRNWVFWFFSRFRSIKVQSRKIHLHYAWTSILVSLIPWLIGAIGASLAKGLPIYIMNLTPYFHFAGFSIALIAYGWYAEKLCYVISTLSAAFSQNSEKRYKQIVRKRADQIANKMWPFVTVSLFFLVLNLGDVIAIWNSTQPTTMLASWTVGPTRIYFGILYGILHGVITSFLLASGVVGLVGTLLILKDIFSLPLNLFHYRRTEVVIGFITWLVMWTLIGLASVLIFSRPIIGRTTNIAALYTSGLSQSIIGTLLIIAIGVLPITQIANAIARAKRTELFRLDYLYDQVHTQLIERIREKNSRPDSVFSTAHPLEGNSDASEIEDLKTQFEMIDKLIKHVESIPILPIQWGSVLRVVFGTAISIGSSLLKEGLPQMLR